MSTRALKIGETITHNGKTYTAVASRNRNTCTSCAFTENDCFQIDCCRHDIILVEQPITLKDRQTKALELTIEAWEAKKHNLIVNPETGALVLAPGHEISKDNCPCCKEHHPNCEQCPIYKIHDNHDCGSAPGSSPYYLASIAFKLPADQQPPASKIIGWMQEFIERMREVSTAKAFEPFTISVNTEREAQILWHRLNMADRPFRKAYVGTAADYSTVPYPDNDSSATLWNKTDAHVRKDK